MSTTGSMSGQVEEAASSAYYDESLSMRSIENRLPKTVPESGPGRWTNQLEFIQNYVIKVLMRHIAVNPFKKPINPSKKYYDFIDSPMDLTTIQSRLENRYYHNGAFECLQDFQLMFINCYLYNPPKTPIVQDAQELECFLLYTLLQMPEPEENLNPTRRESSSPRQSCNESAERVEADREGIEKSDNPRARVRKDIGAMKVNDNQDGRVTKVRGGKDLRLIERHIPSSSSSSSSKSSSKSSSCSDSSQDEEEQHIPHSTATTSLNCNKSGNNDGNRINTVFSDKDQKKYFTMAKRRRKQYVKLFESQKKFIDKLIDAFQEEQEQEDTHVKNLKNNNCSKGKKGCNSSKNKCPKIIPAPKRKVPMKKSTKKSTKDTTNSNATSTNTTTKRKHKPSTTTTAAAIKRSSSRPLTTKDIKKLNTQIKNLSDTAIIEMLQTVAPSDTTIGDGVVQESFNVADFSAPVQRQMKKFVEEYLRNDFQAKGTKIISKQSKQVQNSTLYEIPPASAPSPAAVLAQASDVSSSTSSSSSDQETVTTFHKTSKTGSQPSAPNEELPHFIFHATCLDNIKKEQSSPQPQPDNRTLTEMAEQDLDYDEDTDEQLNIY